MYISGTTPAVTLWPSGSSLTREQLDDQATKFARGLGNLGLKPGDVIAVLLPNCLEYAVVMHGAEAGGFSYLLLNTHLRADELSAIIEQLSPAAIVAGHDCVKLASELDQQIPVGIQRIMISHSAAGWLDYDALLADQTTQALPPVSRGKMLLLSGGSTGRPKIVIPPPDGLLASVVSATKTMPKPEPHSVVLIPGPLYHTMPGSYLRRSIAARAHAIVMERWSTEGVLQIIHQHRVTLMQSVPTMLSRLLQLDEATRLRYDVSSLEAVVHGSAPCPMPLKLRFMAWIPKLWEGYSMSEGFGFTYLGPDEYLLHPGSVGRPSPWCRIIIRDDDGNQLPPGQVGVVWFSRTDGETMQYLGMSRETAAAYNQYGEGSALDLGYVDDEGYLYLTGRQKDMLIIGGVNVYPVAIEEVLADHPAVADVCVIGRSDADLGEVPVAYVQLREGHYDQSFLAVELQRLCRERLGGLAMPREVTFVALLPRTDTGKIRKDTVGVAAT